ncbi:hypothetical protein [Bacillus massilinigeriensis]|uniref:hypothetical protein n=1 Tax=Bacillus massilionigeriensis TaxID=1805475 RepID=UPI00096B5F90|nr:hypothetical protein [Bacillus massilionigeriensis]
MLNLLKLLFIVIIILSLNSCGQQQRESVINNHSEVILTKNNELQFRFKLNEQTLGSVSMYKLKISIHNKKLASALGSDEIIYGEDVVFDGEYVEVKQDKQNVIIMDPIPLKKDLHTFELERLIEGEHAITVQIYNNQRILANAPLTNFSAKL